MRMLEYDMYLVVIGAKYICGTSYAKQKHQNELIAKQIKEK